MNSSVTDLRRVITQKTEEFSSTAAEIYDLDFNEINIFNDLLEFQINGRFPITN
jgi:hypothetical protein